MDTIIYGNWNVYQKIHGPQIDPPAPSVLGAGSQVVAANQDLNNKDNLDKTKINYRANSDNFTIYRINSRIPFATEYLVTKYGGLSSRVGTNLGM